MPTLLEINTSPLATSITRELTAEYVSAWKASHPGGEVVARDLAANPSKPLDGTWVGAAYTPEDARTPEQNARLAESDQLIEELKKADEYVIGVSMHNFSIPSVLKLWIDQVARAGKTFSYGPDGVKGLLKGKKATILAASGGVYEVGTPAGALNFVEPYLRSVLGFLGITDVTFVTASGVSQVNTGKVDRTTFLKPTLERVRTLVA
ncbi:FMN-dependent NADH-azoreductase 3 [Edaphobacter acidisoli]|uniref:FMN dependent NADH:quinone oxidoreductase n=1 Tax=Edaphobacter acidisoli TaxID=2040573 RepID=A0A916W799_9BACT|nr:NAD(P)H-dependent oxidoreductase [Edaphobacter acidisoli]GGA71903.1 FMN-dependent NADH-azoreductase 3 [Edaphobacter acidisoli]